MSDISVKSETRKPLGKPETKPRYGLKYSADSYTMKGMGRKSIASDRTSTSSSDSTDMKHQDASLHTTERYPAEFAAGRLTDVKHVRPLVETMAVGSNLEGRHLTEEIHNEMVLQYLTQAGVVVKRASFSDRRGSFLPTTPSTAEARILEEGAKPDRKVVKTSASRPKKPVHKLRPSVRPEPGFSVPSHLTRSLPRREIDAKERRDNLSTLLLSRVARRRTEKAAEDKKRIGLMVASRRVQEYEQKERMSRRQRVEQELMAQVLRAKISWDQWEAVQVRAKVRILVVGAGLAGLSAAAELLRLGFRNITVLEGSHRVGGRLHTVHLSGERAASWPAERRGHMVELGSPAWLTGDVEHSVYTFVKDQGLLDMSQTHKRPQCRVLTPEGRQLEDRFVATALRFFLHTQRDASLINAQILPAKRRKASLAFSDYTRVRRRHLLTGVKEEELGDLATAVDSIGTVWRFATGDSHGDMAADLSGCQRQSNSGQRMSWRAVEPISHDVEIPLERVTPSMAYLRKFSATSLAAGKPRALKFPIKSTYHVCCALMRRFPPGMVHCGQRVRRVDWTCFRSSRAVKAGSGPEIKVHCSNNNVYSADHVIMTVPLGHLKKFAGEMFHPPLTDKKLMALDRMGVGTISKIILVYSSPSWRAPFHLVWSGRKSDDAEYDRAALSSHCLQVVTAVGSPHILEVTLLGDLPASAASSDAHVAAEMAAILTLLLCTSGAGLNEKIGPPDKIIRSSWGQDPLYLGSHPYLRQGYSLEDLSRLANPIRYKDRPVIQFAGDYTWSDLARLTHAARASGLREAKRLGNFYNNYFGYENLNPSFSEKAR